MALPLAVFLACGGQDAISDPENRDLTVAVLPESAELEALGNAQAFRAVVRDGGERVTGLPVSWSSTRTAVAAVDSAGVARARAPGETTIRAEVEGVAGTARLKVDQKIVSVAVSPDNVVLVAPGETRRLEAVARDPAGNEVEDASFEWRSSDPSIAEVSSDGRVTAMASGTMSIRAEAGGKQGSSTVSVLVPIFQEDWSRYEDTEHLKSDPRGTLTTFYENGGEITLDRSDGSPGTDQSVKAKFVGDQSENSGEPAVGMDQDWLDADGNAVESREVWFEIYVKFSTNWKTDWEDQPGRSGNPDHKTLFISAPGCGDGRNEYKIGTYPDPKFTIMATGTPGLDDSHVVEEWIDGADEAWDGQWHRLRGHWRMGENGKVEAWFDGRKLGSWTAEHGEICGEPISGFALGRNMNQWPAEDIWMKWGRIRVWDSNPGW